MCDQVFLSFGEGILIFRGMSFRCQRTAAQAVCSPQVAYALVRAWVYLPTWPIQKLFQRLVVTLVLCFLSFQAAGRLVPLAPQVRQRPLSDRRREPPKAPGEG